MRQGQSLHGHPAESAPISTTAVLSRTPLFTSIASSHLEAVRAQEVRHPHLQFDLRGLSSRGVAIHDQLQPAGPKQQEKCRRHPRSQSGQEQQEGRL